MLSWRGCRNVLKGRQAENVTSGSVDMGAYTPIPNVFTHFSGANLIGGFQPATWDIQVVQTGPAPGAVIAWDFNGLGLWGNMYTTASPPTPLGSAPVPTGNVTGTVLTLDLRALTRNWNGEHQTWGIDNITATASGGDSGTFTATWTRLCISRNYVPTRFFHIFSAGRFLPLVRFRGITAGPVCESCLS